MPKQASVETDFPAVREAPQILIVDDDADLRALLHRLLEPAFGVTTVADAESALVLVATHAPFDLIISDFMLPGLSGLEFLERIRQEGLARGTKIVMISGHGPQVVAERAQAAGADAFLGKPFTPAQLRSTIGGLLHGPLESARYPAAGRTASLSG